jgi:hypothetical protein
MIPNKIIDTNQWELYINLKTEVRRPKSEDSVQLPT